MTNSAASFGCRGDRTDVRGGPNEPQPTLDGVKNALILKLLVGIPTVIAVIVVMSFTVKPDSSGSASSSVASAECRSKTMASSVLDINWCQAGTAALQGAVRGVAVGAKP